MRLNRVTGTVLGAAFALAIFVAAPAEVQAQQTSSGLGIRITGSISAPVMRTGRYASPPIGHRAFCKSFPDECAVHGGRSPIQLTPSRWQDLVRVNNYVNDTVKAVTDEEYYGQEEVWTLPQGYGDCEDYVLLKRKQLVARGWPTSDLLVAVVFDEVGAGHAVLVVRTDRGDYVLDNKVSDIRLWSETGYRYVKRQDIADPKKWVAIDDSRWQPLDATGRVR
ncbi:transglutaminase-like cysteine peptidase [Afifella aestuarii]|uniref:transglutaminase-like cysteine peptidase n=1 Tax=Afifella aestuarii TaxID=1909496 RepID=UPI000FE338B5|nr:transglutaminase-like cysteine peptidase [Afifella aestuarii]